MHGFANSTLHSKIIFVKKNGWMTELKEKKNWIIYTKKETNWKLKLIPYKILVLQQLMNSWCRVLSMSNKGQIKSSKNLLFS